MPEFKFQIGELVLTKVGIADAMLSAKVGGNKVPNHFIVAERKSQECPGGVQLHYTLGRGQDGSVSMLEQQLAHPSEFDIAEYRKIVETIEDEHEQKRDERWGFSKVRRSMQGSQQPDDTVKREQGS